MSAEMQEVTGDQRRVQRASMGPRSDERGNLKASGYNVQIFHASMGPRSDERGNAVALPHNLPSTEWLQWGRAQMSAEMRELRKRNSWPFLLQWGRAQMSAEIRTHPWRPGHGGHGASMGPRSDERGNTTSPSPMSRSGTSFNGAALR